jgi:segregation and condensation protein B
MSLKAKIEAVIYAAEEPVTLAQLAGIFAQEVPAAEAKLDENPTTVAPREAGDPQAEDLSPGETSHVEEMALLTGQERSEPAPTASPAPAEPDAKLLARQRERHAREQIKTILDELIEEYSSSDRGMEIREVAGGYRIATKPEYHDSVRGFIKSLKPPMKLSLQALETLAVIAYKQPVTAPEVAEIRGVDSSGVLGSLVSRKLITTAGRKQVIGRPILYKTTREFLLRFGLKDLGELPSIEEFEKLASDIEVAEDEGTEVHTETANLPFEADPPTETSGGNHSDEGGSVITDVSAPSLAVASSSARVEVTDSPSENSVNVTTSHAEEDHVSHG